MGDRVLFQVVNGSGEFGPVVYCHWAGARAPEIVRKLAARMAGRSGDFDYATARLVQECTAGDPDGALSFGVWNADKQLTAEDSHGDAGVVLIDCSHGFRCECLGGYLRADAEGMPCA
jgi:hypothetical protein